MMSCGPLPIQRLITHKAQLHDGHIARNILLRLQELPMPSAETTSGKMFI